jgi:D-sedoheptulose 7-phosphate isomerase
MTIGFTGYQGGRLGELVDIHINVPSNSIEQVEDIHLVLEHMVTQSLRDQDRTARAPEQGVVPVKKPMPL